ncbi:hypothetical protein [Pantoea ananatis]|uniref:hypothetical protein n=1 Tax=Pantoea ananas TaxID=553 RepID=UPI000763190B|nr:hypothetical protein [Pantoea ananatis]AMB73319.1 hypothetical protein AW734_00610 [Pantoea ananatis]
MSLNQKKIDLNKDVKEIAEKAIAAFELKYDESGHSNLHDPLLRWCDFLRRYIPPMKREVRKSDLFPVNIPDDAKVGLQRIEDLLSSGGDVNPYQSKTLTLFNDTSGKREKQRTDGLWADWGIHHLHLPLNPADANKKYSERSEWVLFLKVYDNFALFIDVKHHGKSVEPHLFSQRALIETLIRNWPEAAEQYVMQGVSGLASEQPITDESKGRLRGNGVNIPIELNGKVYAPLGMGVTTAVTSVAVTILRDRISGYARQIEEIFTDESGPFIEEIKSAGVMSPNFEMCLMDDGGLGIHEKGIDKVWKFPRENKREPRDVFVVFNNTFLPEWAGPVVLEHWRNNY